MSWVTLRSLFIKSARPSLEPIVVNNVLERVQIDMRLERGDIYEPALHIKDHFSKYSFLRPLTAKGARQVARELEYWIQLMGPLRTLQYNNGREFKGAVLHILQWHGITLINSNPRHLRSQGLVKQGNSVVERKVKRTNGRAWNMRMVFTIS